MPYCYEEKVGVSRHILGSCEVGRPRGWAGHPWRKPLISGTSKEGAGQLPTWAGPLAMRFLSVERCDQQGSRFRFCAGSPGMSLFSPSHFLIVGQRGGEVWGSRLAEQAGESEPRKCAPRLRPGTPPCTLSCPGTAAAGFGARPGEGAGRRPERVRTDCSKLRHLRGLGAKPNINAREMAFIYT